MTDNRKQRGQKREHVVFPVGENLSEMPENYMPFFVNLKEYIRKEKFQSIRNVNQRMILMYWHIGSSILEMQQNEGWGTKVIDRLSKDLKEAFPEETGFSPRNLKYMRKFAEAWTDIEIVQRTVAQIPWRSNITLIEPGHVSQLNMYLNVVNDVLCEADDNKTIGLLLVKQKDRVVAEYTLSGIKNPIGISNWENEVMKSLPENLKSSLPSIEEIEKEFGNDEEL